MKKIHGDVSVGYSGCGSNRVYISENDCDRRRNISCDDVDKRGYVSVDDGRHGSISK